MTERDRLNRAISVIQILDQEQSSDFIANPSLTRGRGRPLGSRNKTTVSTIDLPQDSNGEQRESVVSFSKTNAALKDIGGISK